MLSCVCTGGVANVQHWNTNVFSRRLYTWEQEYEPLNN